MPFDPMQSAAMKAAKTETDALAELAEQAVEELMSLPAGSPTKPLSVAQVNSLINQLLLNTLPPVFHIAGELSNFRTYDRGHAFFTLKEAGAELPCVLWKDALARLKFKPKDGLAVIARGSLKLYEPQGKLQLYVETLLPQGTGGLELAFRQLCEKLKSEGLFEQARKRPLPKFPQRIAIITSKTGDVLHDVLTTALRRYPALHILLYPVRVQGEDAPKEIIAALKHLNAHNKKLSTQHSALGTIDLILLVRGGGSLEDLWAFNDEALARAIVASKIPIATGIGHEPDTTIADLVGDLRGPTPTGITELTIPDAQTLLAQLTSTSSLLTRDIRRQLESARTTLARTTLEFTTTTKDSLRTKNLRLEKLSRQIEQIEPRHAIAQGWRRVEDAHHRLERSSPRIHIQRHHERLTHLHSRLHAAQSRRLNTSLEKLAALAAQLRVVSPQSILDRGFSITTTPDGKIIRSATQVKKGDLLTTRVSDGTFDSTVGKPKQSSLF